MQKPAPDSAARLRMSLAACALMMATSTADPAAQAASGAAAMAAATHVSQSVILKKIQAYCTTSWRNAGISRQDWDDCTQDVLARILDSIPDDQPSRAINKPTSEERRELNRAIWATAQRWRRAPRHSSLAQDMGRPASPDPWPERMEALGHVRKAIDSSDARLSPTQKDIVTRWSNGQAISSIASELKLSPARVSDEKYKAIQKLKQYFNVDEVSEI